MGLTNLEESLCQAYLVTSDKSEALRQSKYKTDGWKPESINRKAKELFDKVKIASRVAELLEMRSKRTDINADYVLKRLVQIDEMDLLDILDENLAILPLSDWPKVWRVTISSIEVLEEFSNIGGERVSIGMIKKLKLPDKVKNIELIGRHVDIQAWKDKVDVSGVIGLKDIMDDIDGDTSDLPSND